MSHHNVFSSVALLLVNKVFIKLCLDFSSGLDLTVELSTQNSFAPQVCSNLQQLCSVLNIHLNTICNEILDRG